MRRSQRVHFKTDKTAPDNLEAGKTISLALCGETLTWLQRSSTEENNVTCPDCAARLGEQRLASLPQQPMLVAKHNLQGYRFCYEVMFEGAHVGYLVYEGAYGGGRWRVATICIEMDPERVARRGEIGVGYHLQTTELSARYEKFFEYHSKETALVDMPTFVLLGKLKTVAQLRADQADAEARWEQRQAERRREDAREAQETAETILALEELLATSITNFQRAGLQTALSRLRTKEVVS